MISPFFASVTHVQQHVQLVRGDLQSCRILTWWHFTGSMENQRVSLRIGSDVCSWVEIGEPFTHSHSWVRKRLKTTSLGSLVRRSNNPRLPRISTFDDDDPSPDPPLVECCPLETWTWPRGRQHIQRIRTRRWHWQQHLSLPLPGSVAVWEQQEQRRDWSYYQKVVNADVLMGCRSAVAIDSKLSRIGGSCC